MSVEVWPSFSKKQEWGGSLGKCYGKIVELRGEERDLQPMLTKAHAGGSNMPREQLKARMARDSTLAAWSQQIRASVRTMSRYKKGESVSCAPLLTEIMISSLGEIPSPRGTQTLPGHFHVNEVGDVRAGHAVGFQM